MTNPRCPHCGWEMKSINDKILNTQVDFYCDNHHQPSVYYYSKEFLEGKHER